MLIAVRVWFGFLIIIYNYKRTEKFITDPPDITPLPGSQPQIIFHIIIYLFVGYICIKTFKTHVPEPTQQFL